MRSTLMACSFNFI